MRETGCCLFFAPNDEKLPSLASPLRQARHPALHPGPNSAVCDLIKGFASLCGSLPLSLPRRNCGKFILWHMHLQRGARRQTNPLINWRKTVFSRSKDYSSLVPPRRLRSGHKNTHSHAARRSRGILLCDICIRAHFCSGMGSFSAFLHCNRFLREKSVAFFPL
jgi:hypothetical protein